MTGSKRALAVFAAGALFTPLVSLGSPALAAGEATPPAPRDITELCQNVPDDYNPFTDIRGNTFEQNIECLAFAEITQGLSGGNQYGPGFSVTRGQMASFIARLIDTADELDTGDNVKALPAAQGDDAFIDVQPNYVHRANIDRLDEAGIVQGGPGGRPANVYGPELEVTRAQMASFIKRALEYMTGDNFDTALDFFTDDENAQPHEPNINAVAAEGIAVGDGNDTYNPFQSVSRGQMSAFLTRTLDVLFEDGDIEPIGGVEDRAEVTAGEVTDGVFTLTVEGDDIESITVSGACIEEQTFDASADNEYEVVVNDDAEAGPCEITVVTTFENGDEETDIVDVEIPENEAPAVTVQDSTVSPGQPIEFTVEGDDIDSVAVSGPCVDSVTRADDANTTTAGFQVSVPVRNNATAGQCTISLVITNNEGETFNTSFNVTIEQVAGATTRPELVSAQITRTVAQGQQTPSDPVGTTVVYTFDEAVAAVAGNANLAAGTDVSALFHAYRFDRTEVTGATFVSRSGNQVTIRFTGADTAERAAAITVATVDFQAVTDAQGQANPEGDATLGTTSGGGAQPLPAGVTTAPDLVSVGNFRQGATAGQTAVDFTFDQNATIVNPSGFSLILLNNREGTNNQSVQAGGVSGDNELVCQGPAAGSTNASGGTVAGGNGTTTITVICANPDGQDDNNTAGDATDPTIAAAQVARGTVAQNTVNSGANTDATLANRPNPLQAVDVSNGGNTREPDLVSVELRPGATAGANDQAVFTFDQVVNTANAAGFFLYDRSANETGGASSAQINQSNGTQVLVTFNTTAADLAVGGSVRDGAVVTAANTTVTPNTPALANEQDEVGVANTTQQEGRTAGRTNGPDLTGVALRTVPSPIFGAPDQFVATYTFDEDVTAVQAGRFFLYQADGTRLQATNCAITTAASGQTAEDVDNTVTCTAFGTSNSATIGSAVLGTVDNGAVTEETGGLTNVEGAEFTTGGTGTRTA